MSEQGTEHSIEKADRLRNLLYSYAHHFKKYLVEIHHFKNFLISAKHVLWASMFMPTEG